MVSHSQNKVAAGADMGRFSPEASAHTQWPAMSNLHLTTGHGKACHDVCVYACVRVPVLEPRALHPALSQIFICCTAVDYGCTLACLLLHCGRGGERKQPILPPSPWGEPSHCQLGFFCCTMGCFNIGQDIGYGWLNLPLSRG